MRWLIILLCFSLSSLHTHAQKGYEKEWKEVTQLQEKGLPRSVIEICEKIYQKASVENNFPEQLRAFLVRMDTRTELDRDSFYTDFSALQKWQVETPDSLQQSVLAQVILDKLTGYAEMNAYQIRQRKETEEITGKNIRTWSREQFRMRCQQLINESLRNPELLAHSSTKPFKGSILLGDASRYFMHDMLHLAGTHGVKVLERLKNTGFLPNQEFQTESKSIYTYLQNYYTAQGNRSGSLLLSLNLLELKKTFNEISDSIYVLELGKLIEKNRDLEVCAEVYLQKATSLRDQKKRTEAVALIDQALERYYRYDRAGALKQLRKEILNPSLFLQLARVAYPGEQMDLRVTHRNLQGFTLRFYPLAMDALDTRLTEYTDQNFLKKYGGKPTDRHFNLLPSKDYNDQDTILHVEAPSNGIYIVEVVPDKETPDHERMLLRVTSLQALNRKLPNKDTEIIVVDRKSGYPVADATLLLYKNRKGEYVYTATHKTDAQGRFVIPPQSDQLRIYVQYGKDKALPEFYAHPANYQFQTGHPQEHEIEIKLLTDRGLYRPGETVHVKGIAYQQSGDSTWVIAGQEFTLTLLDANRQEVGNVTLRSNEWGSFTHTFTLPEQTLNGRFRIRCKESYAYIQVEEFKRPSFQVVIDTLQSAPQLGDSVTLTGKAFTFNGFPLQDDSVSYTILREPRYLWRIMDYSQAIIASGSTRTNAQGEFSVSFRLKKPEFDPNEEQIFRFRIQADVTDAAGESQRVESSLVAGNRSLALSCNLAKEICKDSVLQVTFRAENLNGTLIPTRGTTELIAQNSKKVVWSTSFEANRSMSINDWNTLPSGAYLLKVSANDPQGRPCKWEQEILLFSMHDTRPPVQEPIWSKQFQQFFPENGPAEILFGTNQKQAYVFYTILNNTKLLESKRLILNDTLIHISLPYKKEYEKGILLNLCFVKDGQMYQESFEIKQPLPKKELTLKWDVFRDHLQPGQKEEWRLTIHKPNGQPALAELMATMYDASLDKLYPFNPSFKLYFSRGISSYQYEWWGGDRYIPSALVEFPFKNYKYPEFIYDHWRFFTQYQGTPVQRISTAEFEGLSVASIDGALQGRIAGLVPTAKGSLRRMQKEAVSDLAASPTQNSAMADQKSTEESAFDGASQTSDSYIEPNALVRQNFNETAFFYPQLYTNENGEVSLSFTLPDALTKWRFIGIAQTKDVMTGMLEGYATSSKPFMLTTHLPRYLRQGDITDLGGLIRNISGKTVNGFVKCEIFDPQTNKILKQFRQPFQIQNDSAQAISFRLEPLKDVEFVGIRMVADGGTFSDGEQHLLAVLSNKSRLVESIPLSLRGNGSKEYSLAPLFNHHSPTATDRRITVEMTVNPSWLAVQALPYLNKPANENALSYATAYYANTLSQWIVKQNPTLKQALEAWKTDSTSAQSNLQRSPELQELLLQETPWVEEAQNEAQRQVKLVTLTETGTLNYQRNEMLRKLKELQLANGSFPWFRGMFPSYSTTAYVLETLGRLTALTGEKESPLSELIRKNAYNYLQSEMTQAYKRITRKNEYALNEQALNYLYICTLIPEEIPASAQKAHQFYLNALRPSSLTGLSLFGRATATLVLLHEGRKAEAEAFYRSLKEYAVGNEDMGSYYANLNGLGDPTLTLTRALEAAQAMGDTALVNDFKIHLLRQKQTQVWNSSVSTANAVYALLKGEKSLTSGAGTCSVTLGKQIIRCEPKAGNIDALMGYTKVSFTGKETDAKTATFTHTGNGICWGAVYGECMEFLNRIQMQGVQVQVNKEFFVKQEQANSFIWKQVTANTRLRKGDQLMTRLTVTTDRDLDFVTLKDQRAACLEPIQPLSGYRSGGYYQEQEDASSILFFDRLAKGTHVFELENYITLSGTYNGGMAQLQSAYATEFTGHSGTSTLVVE